MFDTSRKGRNTNFWLQLIWFVLHDQLMQLIVIQPSSYLWLEEDHNTSHILESDFLL
jgi:hypothetical protein